MTSHTVVTLTSRDGLETLRSEWEDLFCISGATNPFLHPSWVLAWCDCFVRPSEIVVLTARHLGRLVGVAPFYRRRIGWPSGAGTTHLRVFGAGRHGELTEVPGILVDPRWTRSVFRQFVGHLLDVNGGWDWVEIPLGHDQGWFEPEWAQRNGSGPPATVIHKSTKPCVVMALSDDWEATVAGLKRNVRQSIHRGRNRLTRSGRDWKLEVVSPDGYPGFLETLAALHRARAAMPGKVRHPDQLADPRLRRFLELAGRRMADSGHAFPCILWVDGRIVAARLILQAGETLFLSLSGFDPGHWDENVATVLLAECLRFGITRGAKAVNFGTGVDVSKLRWSENVERHEDFLLVAPGRKSRLAFSVYWQLRSDRVRLDR